MSAKALASIAGAFSRECSGCQRPAWDPFSNPVGWPSIPCSSALVSLVIFRGKASRTKLRGASVTRRQNIAGNIQACGTSLPSFWIRTLLMLLLWSAAPLTAQANSGELRLRVTDAEGLGLRASITISSLGSQYRDVFIPDNGIVNIKPLSYGLYRISVEKQGFTSVTRTVEVRSAIPVEHMIKLEVAPVNTVIKVSDSAPLIDPYHPSSVMQIGLQQIEARVTSLPGRSVQELVNSEPGWLYEGNAVLHPRGSEYQTQFVVDGIPLTDNRSPGLGPEIEADDVESMSIYTAGFPAEYGRKMGGVIEINTKREAHPGLRGQLVLSAGSYESAQSFSQVQDIWGKNMLAASASGSMTSHYLNPVVPENFTNKGTTGDFSLQYERDFTPSDRVIMSVRHELSRFQIPNEFVQEQAGQLQNGDNFETIGTVSYQHIFSANMLGNLSGMVRENANNLYSNLLSTPIIASQHNDKREVYIKGTVSLHRKNQEWKAGIDADTTFLHENFSYSITNPMQFDDGTPASLAFAQSRPSMEQAAFVEDQIRLGNWTVSAGLRWDHYQLLLNRNACSPRLSISRYFPSATTIVHVSYDRVFQTASNENILLSSSPLITSLNPQVLRLPVKPSEGSYYEGGIAKAFSDRVRLDVNVFRRDITNFGDDDQLLNTGVSYPIAFTKAVIYGSEGKLNLVRLGHLTGFVSYSYMVGNAWYPVTGGLFLGDNVTNALTQLSGHFPDSQDQRNTVRTRFQYQLTSRLWLAGGLAVGSGLPFQYGGTYQDALAQYGPNVVSRLDFARGRVSPSLSLNASLGTDLYKSDKRNLHLQVDGNNLNNRLNLIDFGGLFSGNAIGPGRSYGLRLTTRF
jgi:outer membrane cobalamin receptor